MTEPPDLDYGALCIDTSVLHRTGYALEKGLLAQFDQFAGSPVKVVISEVVAKETVRHMAERVRTARAAAEKSLREVQQEVLLPTGDVDRARAMVLTAEPDQDVAQRRFDEFCRKCGALTLSADSVSAREVLDRYFNQEPPFATGDKKEEFPDAYALLSVEKWAEKENLRVLVVSHDKGWKEFCERSQTLVACDNLGTALGVFQPHNAAPRLMAEVNACIVTGVSANGCLESVTGGIKEAVESMEVDVEADSRFYWEAEDVYAAYQGHRFQEQSAGIVAIDLVRVTEQHLTVRLMATIACRVHATFALSMTDPIDKDEVGLGSQDVLMDQDFESDVLVTFVGDFSRGLRGVTVESVEVVDNMPTVEFGEIEMDWGHEDDN